MLADPAVAGVGSSVGAVRLQRLGQPRPHVHQPEAARRARRPHHGPRHRSPAPRARGHRGHQRVHERGAGHPRRRAARAARPTSSRCGAPRSTTLYAWVPKVVEQARPDPRHHRRQHRPRAGRPAGQHHHRPPDGGPPRRAHAGHRQRAQQCLLAAADLHHLHAAQPVPRDPGGRPALPARPDRPRAHLRAGPGRRAGAAHQRHHESTRRWRRWSSITRARSRP